MFYIFHGEDDHSIREQLADLQERLGSKDTVDLNTTRFNGVGLSLSELRHVCDSVPFLSERRLVIVNDFIRNNPSQIEELLAYLPLLPDTTRLIFIETKPLKADHALLKFAQDNEAGYVRAFNRLEGGSLERWIRSRVVEKKGRISPPAAHLLAVNTGSDLALLENEVEKLTLFKGAEQIQVEDITLLCPSIAEASIFELVDAIGSRNGPNAADLLNRKLAEGVDPFFLFSMIIRQFRLLIQVKELAEEGSLVPEITKILNLHAFVAGKLYQQSKNFSLPQLEQIFSRLLEIDIEIKTGKNDLNTALPLLVAGVAA